MANEKALDTFMMLHAQAVRLANVLSAHMDDHMGISPSEVNWAHVGTIGKIVEDLTSACEFLNIEV